MEAPVKINPCKQCRLLTIY